MPAAEQRGVSLGMEGGGEGLRRWLFQSSWSKEIRGAPRLVLLILLLPSASLCYPSQTPKAIRIEARRFALLYLLGGWAASAWGEWPPAPAPLRVVG